MLRREIGSSMSASPCEKVEEIFGKYDARCKSKCVHRSGLQASIRVASGIGEMISGN